MADKEFKMPVKGADDIWMVNPGGAIHLMTKDAAAQRLKHEKGWRPATKDEVAKYEKAKGKQLADKPLCAPYVNLPPEIVLPDEPPAAVKPSEQAIATPKPKDK